MDSSVSPKDEIWFLRVCQHISNATYHVWSTRIRHHVSYYVNVFTSAASGSHDTYRLFCAFPVLGGNFSDIAVELEFGHPRCVCNNEVKYNESQNTTKFISLVIAVVLIKQNVSAYCEAIIRFTMLATGDY